VSFKPPVLLFSSFSLLNLIAIVIYMDDPRCNDLDLSLRKMFWKEVSSFICGECLSTQRRKIDHAEAGWESHCWCVELK